MRKATLDTTRKRTEYPHAVVDCIFGARGTTHKSVTLRLTPKTSEKKDYAPAKTGHDRAQHKPTDLQARSKAKPAGLAMIENTCEANGSQIRIQEGATRRDRYHRCLHGHCPSPL